MIANWAQPTVDGATPAQLGLGCIRKEARESMPVHSSKNFSGVSASVPVLASLDDGWDGTCRPNKPFCFSKVL